MPHGHLKVGIGFGEAIPAFGMSIFYTYVLGDGISFDAPSDPTANYFLWASFFTIVFSVLGLVFLCKPVDCMAYTYFFTNPLNICGLIIFIFFVEDYFFVPLIAALLKIMSFIFGVFFWKKIKEDARNQLHPYPLYQAQPVYDYYPQNNLNPSIPYQPLNDPRSVSQQGSHSPFWNSKKDSLSSQSIK